MSFNQELVDFSKSTGVELDTVVRKIALELYDGFTEKTPVDTGRAKGNWNLSVNRINTSVNWSATQKQNVSIKKGDGVKIIYISNSLPYIFALENGSSDQSPKGMVKVTVGGIRAGITNVI
jgi:hypothetical protein